MNCQFELTTSNDVMAKEKSMSAETLQKERDQYNISKCQESYEKRDGI